MIKGIIFLAIFTIALFSMCVLELFYLQVVTEKLNKLDGYIDEVWRNTESLSEEVENLKELLND